MLIPKMKYWPVDGVGLILSRCRSVSVTLPDSVLSLPPGPYPSLPHTDPRRATYHSSSKEAHSLWSYSSTTGSPPPLSGMSSYPATSQSPAIANGSPKASPVRSGSLELFHGCCVRQTCRVKDPHHSGQSHIEIL